MYPPPVPSTTVTELPPAAALLDVRESQEWLAGHIDGAVHIPLGELPARVGEVPPGGPLVVICRSGNRSARAVAWLNENGFDSLNLIGGMQAWDGEGRPMVSELGTVPFVR